MNIGFYPQPSGNSAASRMPYVYKIKVSYPITPLKSVYEARGYKMISYGNSVTEGGTWQRQVAEILGLDFDSNACFKGYGTHYEDAEGHVCYKNDKDDNYYYFSDTGDIVEINLSELSEKNNRRTGWSGAIFMSREQLNTNGVNFTIFERIKEAPYYNPDILFLFAGFNDIPYLGERLRRKGETSWAQDHNYDKLIGNTSDDAYYGLSKGKLTDADSLGLPSYCSCYKGTLEFLSKTLPKCKVVSIGLMKWFNYVDPGEGSRFTDGAGNPPEIWNQAVSDLNKKMEEICQQYAIPFINLENRVGINSLNWESFLSGPHPNLPYGGDRVAQCIISQL